MVSTFSFLGKMEQVFLANSVVASMSLFDVVKLKGLAIVLAKRKTNSETKGKSKNNLIEIKKIQLFDVEPREKEFGQDFD